MFEFRQPRLDLSLPRQALGDFRFLNFKKPVQQQSALGRLEIVNLSLRKLSVLERLLLLLVGAVFVIGRDGVLFLVASAFSFDTD